MRINHNIAAQIANANLKRADDRVSASLQRLSSGYKINKAADDSAGLAISNKMRAQVRALEQASRNADDGVSLIRTAEGSLGEIENMLQRCRELSVRAASDTLVIADREAAQKEVDQLLEEVDRIASDTEFNGKRLLSGSCSRVVICVDSDGKNADGVRPLGVSEKVEAGEYSVEVTTLASPAGASVNYSVPGPGSIDINGTTIDITASDTEASLYQKVLSVCDMMDIDVTDDGTSFELSTRATGANQQISYRGVGDEEVKVSRGQDAEVTLGSGFTGKEGIKYDGGLVTVYGNDGFEMSFAAEKEEEVTFKVYDTGALKLQIGANEAEDVSIDFSKVSCETLGLRDANGASLVNLCSGPSAGNAIELFDNAIQAISTYRSKIGAYENRLDSTITSLDINVENTTNSLSRIMDTDMAEAMTQYTQENVLSQAATSILAQANNRPQQVMSLLQS